MEVTMKCPECSEFDWTFDDVLGENICDHCGLVHVVRPFEEASRAAEVYEVSNVLGSMIIESNSNYKTGQLHRMKKHNMFAAMLSETDRRTITLCNMILSNYSIRKSIRNNVGVYLRSLNAEHVFRGCSVEHRAAALSFYILKESNIPMNIRTHSKYSMVC